ncbi:MAG: nucleotidyltransferase domain-containing protein [Chloroflexi bacterium]|nr:nucleotidyltransferase domain-containing protein [Chloroflexota bacterium]
MKTKREKDIGKLKESIVPILKRHNVNRAAIFGSLATGGAKETSDLDLLVEFKGEKSLLDLAALKLDLEEATNRKVDVVTYRALHPLIRDRVLKEQVRVL